MATVTNLQVDRERLCPGEKATVVATTVASPDENNIVTWTINGQVVLGLPQAPNTLEVSYRSPAGSRAITASLNSSSLSVTVIFLETDIKIELEPDLTDGVITAEPQMQPPMVRARAIGIGGPISVLEWRVLIGGAAFSEACPPNGPVLDTSVDLSPTGGGEQITINLENMIRGGSISIFVRGTVNGCETFDFADIHIDGTNPQQSDIQAALPHDALRRIACKESEQRQFDAPPNGGTGFCPLFGPGGKVGIMQIPNPTADEVWNWRLNVAKGIEIFNVRVAAAHEYPSRVRDSEGFQNLVGQFNQRRQQQGLDPIQVILPEFTTGNFDGDDDLQQLELDAIRGYNGWNGSDRFGLELHEFKVAVDRIDGEEVLVVANINEETLQGEAAWKRVPVADRPTDWGSPDYVDDVLAFPARCEPSQVPRSLRIRAQDGTSPPCGILRTGGFRTYRAFATPVGGTFNWFINRVGGGEASIVGSNSGELVTVRGDLTSTRVDDIFLTVQYSPPPPLTVGGTESIDLTVADVEKISVRVKASAAATPGRGPLADHQFDCTETAEAFPPDTSLILLRGDFEDVELQATVKPVGTPLAWDVKRARDDHGSLGTEIPKLDPDAVDVTKAKLKANETGSFFVRVFGDCGDKKFDPNVPFKLVPTVLVQAELQADASKPNPANTKLPQLVEIGGANYVQVQTGDFDIQNPGTAAIHMKATVNVMSGGANGRRLIEPFFATTVFAGWVSNIRADVNIRGSYTGGHAISQVFTTNSGTGPDGMFRPGDSAPNLVAPPLLDAGWPNSGAGGGTVTLSQSRISPTDRFVGQQWIVEAIDSPSTIYQFLHPIFSTPGALVELRTFRFELKFSAHLCLWTNRSSGAVGGVAERSYGVLRSFNWDMLAEWNIDPATINITVVTPMSIPISGGFTPPRLDRPTNARCEVCPPTAQNTRRRDGRI